MTHLQRRILMSSVILLCLMQTIDTTIAIVALPHMQGTMSATPDQISWVLTSYIVATAMTLPTSTYVCQRFGIKTTLIAIICSFSIASILCGLAQSLGQVVLFRLLQGVAGAFIMPLAQIVILDYYSVEERPKMMAIWGASSMVGPIIGPMMGGYLTDSLSWRWVFYINLPLGILTLIGVWLVPMETKRDTSVSFRWQGFLYLAGGIGALQLVLDRGNLKDWFASTEIQIEAILATLLFYLFVTHSLSSRRPFLDFTIFKNRNLSISLIVMGIGGSLLYATLSLMPPYLQTLLGYPVFTSGLLLAPRGISFVLALLIYARYGARVDPRVFLTSGIIISTASLWMMQQFDLNVSEADIIWSGIVQGFGLGLYLSPIPVLGFSTLAKHFQSDGAALFSLVRNVGSSIGIAAITASVARWTQINHASLTEHVTRINPLLRPETMSYGFGLDSALGLQLMDAEIVRQSMAIAYLNDFRLLMWINGACILSIFFIRLQKPGASALAQASE